MTIESDFLNFEDPEKFAVAIQKNPPSIKDVLNILYKKLAKKESWESKESLTVEAPKIFLQDIEY